MAGHYFLSSEKLKMCKKEHTFTRGTVHNTQLMMKVHNFSFLYFVAQVMILTLQIITQLTVRCETSQTAMPQKLYTVVLRRRTHGKWMHLD